MSAPGPFTVSYSKRFDDRDSRVGGVQLDYREAFATLEEAHERVDELGDGRDVALDQATGVVALLPNGDVIEVEATTWKRLADDCAHADECGCAGMRGDYASGYTQIWDDDRGIRHEDWISCRPSILAAWNAEYGIGIESREEAR